MADVVFAGFRGSDDFIATARPTHYREGILYLYPNGSAPLTALTSKMKKKSVDDAEFSWYEKTPATQMAYINDSAITDTKTTIAVDDGAGGSGAGKHFKAGHLLLNSNTNEVMLVTSVAGDVLTVTRDWAHAHESTTADNDPLVVVGTAYEEGANVPDSITYDPARKYNYTEIFRTSLGMTRTAKRTRLRTGDSYKTAKREALELHSIEMEKAFLFGGRKEDLTGTHPRRATDGIRSIVKREASGNYQDWSTGPSISTWNDYMEKIFRYGSQEKICFIGSTALNNLAKMFNAASTPFITPGVTVKWGMKFVEYVSNFGVLYFKLHPLFNQVSVFRGTGCIIDGANMVYRYVDDTKFLTNRQNPGADLVNDEFLTEAGLEIHHGESFGWFDNLLSYTP